jgi:hypothetical protein
MSFGLGSPIPCIAIRWKTNRRGLSGSDVSNHGRLYRIRQSHRRTLLWLPKCHQPILGATHALAGLQRQARPSTTSLNIEYPSNQLLGSCATAVANLRWRNCDGTKTTKKILEGIIMALVLHSSHHGSVRRGLEEVRHARRWEWWASVKHPLVSRDNKKHACFFQKFLLISWYSLL